MTDVPLPPRIRLSDLVEGARFRVSGGHSRGIFTRRCNSGIRTAHSELTGKETVMHLGTYVDPVVDEVTAPAGAN